MHFLLYIVFTSCTDLNFNVPVIPSNSENALLLSKYCETYFRKEESLQQGIVMFEKFKTRTKMFSLAFILSKN